MSEISKSESAYAYRAQALQENVLGNKIQGARKLLTNLIASQKMGLGCEERLQECLKSE